MSLVKAVTTDAGNFDKSKLNVADNKGGYCNTNENSCFLQYDFGVNNKFSASNIKY